MKHIARRSTTAGAGRRRLAPIGVSLASGLALVAGFTVTSLSAPAGAANGAARPHVHAHQLAHHTTAHVSKSPHLGQTGPTVSVTPRLAAHDAVHQTFTVNTQDDTVLANPSGTSCLDGSGNCSLRAAVEAANNDYPNFDQINVPAGYDILLNSGNGEIDITNTMFITGLGGGVPPIVDGQGAIEDFYLYSSHASDNFSPAVEMTNLTIQRGSATNGADIYLGDGLTPAADLTLTGVTVQGGNATGKGGGIYLKSDTALWMDAATVIQYNTASSGGGIYNSDGQVFVGGSTFLSNSASSEGGAVYQNGGYVGDSAHYTNNSSPDGGVFYNDYTMSDSGGTFTGNSTGSVTPTYSYGNVIDNEDSASISNATVTGSSAIASNEVYGGSFYNDDQLSLDNVSVSNSTNTATVDGNVYGGVIANDDNLTVSGLTVSGITNGSSSVVNYVEGGVLYNDSTASVTDLTASGTSNRAIGDDIYGGVVSNESTLTMNGLSATGTSNGTSSDDTYIEGGVAYNDSSGSFTDLTASNTTDTGGGSDVYGGVFSNESSAIFSNVVASGTTVTSNSFIDGGVGYNSSDESITINGATISNTSASATNATEIDGGALATDSSTQNGLKNISIDGTTETTAGADVYGALYTDGQTTVNGLSVTNTTVNDVGGGHGYVEGAGWYNGDETSATNVQVLNTTVTADYEVYGGAFSNDGDGTTITNGTFARTSTTLTGTGAAYGTIAYLEEPMTLTNLTMADNTGSVPAASDAYGVYFDDKIQFVNDTIANNTLTPVGGSFGANSGGFGFESSYTESFANSIVQFNGVSNCTFNNSGNFVSSGGNIDSGATCGFTQPTDQQNTNPLVAPVANNGGAVQTAALMGGSPAIDAGVNAECPSTDARGISRPQGPRCDSGAYEYVHQGYWMDASDGGIFSFGNAVFHGSMGGIPLNKPVVGMAATPDGGGYWEVASDGGVFSFGNAGFHGSMGGKPLNMPMVGIAGTSDGGGYWTVASDGGIFSFGDAQFFGSTGSIHLNKPVVGMAGTPDGMGYWLVASDGGIFSYGDAAFYGSTGSIHLNKPVVGMAATPDGMGYWLVASDGGIFSYGDAAFYGSTGSIHLNKPVVGMASTPSGNGYWLFASDGGVFSYGDAIFQGSMGGTPLNKPVVGGAST